MCEKTVSVDSRILEDVPDSFISLAMYDKLGDCKKIKKYVELTTQKRQIKEELLRIVIDGNIGLF